MGNKLSSTGRLVVAALALGLAVPSLALAGGIGSGMGLDGQKFLDSLKEGDTSTALQILKERGPGLVNYHGFKGEYALSIVIRRRDSAWLEHLLSNGADPAGKDENGDTAIVVAARLGDDNAVRTLLAHGAKVDEPNRMGETALIAAVHQHRVSTVRLLIEQGADPARRDHASGLSARDYARRDRRMADLLPLFDAAPKAKKPALDFSGPFR